jgi:hypothetical protein
MQTVANTRRKNTFWGWLTSNKSVVNAQMSCLYGGAGGQEKDNEVRNQHGGNYTAEHWEYDPLLGRRWNLEPKMKAYPWESPYAVFHNNPIHFSDPNGDDPPEKSFHAISTAVNTDLRQSWGASFIKKDDNIKVREAGGTVIKRETASGTEYKVINNDVSKMNDTYYPDYSNVPDGWDIAGEYHTHAYSEKELSTEWAGYGWDGKGMPPSITDISSLANDRHVKDGHVSIVESGDKRYGIVVTDKKALRKFAMNALNVVKEDMYDAMYKAKDKGGGKNIDEVIYKTLQAGIQGYEKETGKSAGIQLFKQDIEEETKE